MTNIFVVILETLWNTLLCLCSNHKSFQERYKCLMCVAFGSITHKKSDMSEKFIKTSVDSYGTFLIKNALEPPRKVSYDDLLTEIGEFGWWQQWQIFLYSLPPFMSGALFMLGTFTSKFTFLLNWPNWPKLLKCWKVRTTNVYLEAVNSGTPRWWSWSCLTF